MKIKLLMTNPFNLIFLLIFTLLMPALSHAAEGTLTSQFEPLDLTQHWIGYLALVIFALAYLLAMTEEVTHLRKSKPMVFAASMIWVFIAGLYSSRGLGEQVSLAFRSSLEAYAELFLFIMVSMTYLNAMEDRGVFERLRVWLLSKNFSYRKLFWITGFLAFFISSVCNNLTTALLMGSVIVAMGKDSQRFITLSCINIVVAVNAGGSFSPFGDITTLLAWQKGVVPFVDFFSLLIPAIVNYVVPAAIMFIYIPKDSPAEVAESQSMKRGGWVIIGLFGLTIITATCFENFFNLPPAAGMMLGLTYLTFFSFYLEQTPATDEEEDEAKDEEIADLMASEAYSKKIKSGYVDYFAPMKKLKHKSYQNIDQPFDVFHKVANLEWDTMLFFYGVMMSVAGLSFVGYMTVTSHYLYGTISPTVANILVGIASAFVDNGTIMLAVLTMAPNISEGQWLLVTLTAGVGGSMLAVGSAAGVGLMGQAKGVYTFTTHLKWMPAIALGYAASIAAHFLLNSQYF